MDNKVTTIITEVDKARKGIAVCAVLFLALTGLCFAFSERVLLVLVRLLGKKLVSYSPEEGFIALASLSLYCAFVLTLPVAGYMLWRRLILPRVPAWRHWGGPVIARRGRALRVRGAAGLFPAAAGGDRLPRGVRDPRRSGAHLREEIHLLLRDDADRPRALLPGAAALLLPREARMAEAVLLPKPLAARDPDLHGPRRGHHAHPRRLQHDADDDPAAGALLRLLPRRPRGRPRARRPGPTTA